MSDHDPQYVEVLSRLMGLRQRINVASKSAGGGDPVLVVDVGANVGEFSELALREFGATKLIAVEPTPEIYAALTEKFKSDPRLEGLNACLGAFTGSLDFLVHADTKTSSLFPRESRRRYFAADDQVVAHTSVPITTLDALCAERGITNVALLKMDTQGGEFDILRGARNLLQSQSIDIVYTEFFITSHYAGAPLLPDIWALLDKHDYALYDLFKGPYGADGQLRFGDAVFVSRKFREAALDPLLN
jgi:FkbM family methyltransferase